MTTWEMGAQLLLASGWTFVDPLDNPGAKVIRGVTEEGAIKPSKLTFRLLDDDDVYRPSNAAGPHYGTLRQYLPAAFATGGTVRSTGEVAAYRPGETQDHQTVDGTSVKGYRWVEFDVEGQLRRIGQWDEPLESAMRRQISGYANLAGYWPLEDVREAPRLANLHDASKSGYHLGVTLAGTDGPGGSDKVITLASGGQIGGSFTTMPSSNNGWQMHFSTDALATDATERTIFRWNTSQGYIWEWKQSLTTYRLTVTDPDGVAVVDSATLHGDGAESGIWRSFRFKVTRVSTTVTVEVGWYSQDTGVFWGFEEDFTGATGRPTAWRADGGPNNTNAGYGHVFALYTGDDDLQSFDFRRAFDGFVGETAGARFIRLLGQAGLGWRYLGFLEDFTPMGREPIATLADHIREIQRTEDALVFDAADDRYVTIRGRRQMLNQDPVLELVWPDDCSGMAERTDDLNVFNDVTVRNRDGGEARAVKATGPMSVADIGRVRTTVDVNVDTSQVTLAPLAEYYLEKFTVDAPRFSAITVDLDAHPELEAAAELVDIGDIIAVTGRTPDVLRLRVLTIEEPVRRTRRKLTFTVEPADIWFAGVYDDTSARYAARGHQLADAATDSATAIEVDYTTGDDADGLAWTHDDGDFDIVVAGERMTVTAAAAPSGGTQVLTVTRSVNGVVKAQTAGATVQIADPVRYAR